VDINIVYLLTFLKIGNVEADLSIYNPLEELS